MTLTSARVDVAGKLGPKVLDPTWIAVPQPDHERFGNAGFRVRERRVKFSTSVKIRFDTDIRRFKALPRRCPTRGFPFAYRRPEQSFIGPYLK